MRVVSAEPLRHYPSQGQLGTKLRDNNGERLAVVGSQGCFGALAQAGEGSGARLSDQIEDL